GPYLFLFAMLAVGWYVAKSGGFASTSAGRLETTIVLTLPLLFSGIVFSTLLSSKGQISGMMAMNLLGAVCGGLLEYNSMYFGFQFLYLVAMACYLLAFLSGLALPQRDIEDLSAASARTVRKPRPSFSVHTLSSGLDLSRRGMGADRRNNFDALRLVAAV